MKILVNHYNLTKSEYEEYHQEIVDMTLEDLIGLFQRIPQKDEVPNNPVKIITKDLIFLKITKERIRVVLNITGFRIFPQIGDPFEEEALFAQKPIVFDINSNELKIFIAKGTKITTSRRSKYRNLFLNSYFPTINIIFIIYTVFLINLNIGILISLSVLFSLSIFNLVYIIIYTYRKPVQFKELKYEILILDKLKPIDISYIVLSFSQCFYFIIFIVLSFYLDNFLYQNILWGILIFSSVFLFHRIVLGSFLIISLYLRARLAKELVQQRILSKYYNPKIKDKNKYLSLYIIVRSEKLIKFRMLSILITIITFIFTIIPIIIVTL